MQSVLLVTEWTVTPIFHGNLRFATGFLYYTIKSYMLGTREKINEKKVKRSDKCFFLFALHICLEKRAGSKGSRKYNKGFFQNFLHTCRSSFERRKPAETAGNL